MNSPTDSVHQRNSILIVVGQRLVHQKVQQFDVYPMKMDIVWRSYAQCVMDI